MYKIQALLKEKKFIRESHLNQSYTIDQVIQLLKTYGKRVLE